MKRFSLALLLFVVPAFGFAAPPPAPELGHSPLVPQDFPYGAEVRFEIHGKVHYEYHNTVVTPHECEKKSSTQNENVAINVDYRVAYNHVTVPVANDTELGAAAKQLRLRVTPTSDGTDQGSGGTYDVNGYDESSSQMCDRVDYSQHGTLTMGARPTFADLGVDASDPFVARQMFFFFMPRVTAANPPTYRDSVGSNTKIEPWIYLSDIPSSKNDNLLFYKADWDAVGVEYSSQFRALRTNAVIHLKPITREGTVTGTGCNNEQGGTEEPSQTCNAKFSATYDITVKRHFLYFTKHEYRR